MEKEKSKERQKQILDLVKGFASMKLNDDYVEMAQCMILKLERKKSRPLEEGDVQLWAAAIVHTLGNINYLFDKTSQPNATVVELCQFFKTTKSATAEKSQRIMEMLNLGQHDDEFSIQRLKQSNPFGKLVFINGCLVPLNSLPEEYREMGHYKRRE